MSDDRPVAEEGLVKVGVRERRGTIVEAVRLLSEAGIGVDDLVIRRPTLDDVFLALTGHVAEEKAEAEEKAA
jgi:ABC-2 type transport system ATP-binding protein